MENMTLDLPVYGQKARSLRHSLFKLGRKKLSPRDTPGSNTQIKTGGVILHDQDGTSRIRAVNDLSVTFNEGDRVGLVGPNGAGKSTLLLAISGIYEPTSGILEVDGVTTGLFSLDQGMDPELSGRDNIAIRGRFLGIEGAEINAIIKNVENFTGLGEFLDMPIRTYSAGMLLRLAFAASTCRTSDILLLDELIGVGDADFIKKAQVRLESLISDSGIVVIASHSESIIRRWCNKALYLEHGVCKSVGNVNEVLDVYKASNKI